MIPKKIEMKTYQLTKPSHQKVELEMKNSLFKPNMKVPASTMLRKK
jgi:hypothetical protein